MSTFGGFMPEFPQIRVDFFRQIQGVPPPLACFLSHVHSDHLAGLESLKSPFVYCSAATRALLLRLERYPHRINFEKGILESHKQHYKHLKKLLKPIPLHTPTRIELAPGNEIQVTLFDANHCTGAVMFLIEGNDQAVLYTGDIRAEPWFVNALASNPLLVEYASNMKTLDCIYLDTSFTDDVPFPTKAEGLKELLQKVSKYPPNTEFHFAAWTFGYEEVWMALSRSLNSQIHVDNYKMSLYQSLNGEFSGGERLSGSYLSQEAPILTGHRVGNTDYPGILTLNTKVRLHSCENEIRCSHLNDQTVWIRPIITRTSSGQEIGEMGIGGGGGDLNQRPELELDSDAMIRQLMALFDGQEGSSLLSDIRRILLAGLRSTRKVLVLNDMNLDYEEEELSLKGLTKILTRFVAKQRTAENTTLTEEEDVHLPRVITFPYSRHSSYPELRDLVKLFKPMDVYPCTVNKSQWHEGVSIRALFGNICSGHIFRHDQEVYTALLEPNEIETQESWNTASTHVSQRSSEDGRDLQNNFTGGDNKMRLEAQRTNTAPELAPAGIVSSEGIHRDGCAEPSVSDAGGTRSIFLEANSDPSYAASTEIVRSSPGSKSQYLRRRVSLDECNGSSPKRTRLHRDHTVTKLKTSDSGLHFPGSENVAQPKSQGVPWVSSHGVEDDVHHCQACGWEIWRPSGECTGCGAVEPAYHDAIDDTDDGGNDEHRIKRPWSKRRDCHPPIHLSSNTIKDDDGDHAKPDKHKNLTGPSWDSVSVYDSTSNAEYEKNSFIDDSFIRAENAEDADDSTTEEINYEPIFEQLSSAYRRLEQEHYELIDGHEDPRQDVLGSDYYRSDEAQFEVVDIEVQDPPLSEIILSHLQGDSQSSVISNRRLRTRVDAFLAAPDDWHNISLMSTGDNHTEEEPEL